MPPDAATDQPPQIDATVSAVAAGSGDFASNAILNGFHGTGASARTAAQDKLPPGPAASQAMAHTDLGRITPLKPRFNAAAAATGLPPAVLAAIASRESRCGNVLDAHGFGDGGEAFGVMQVDRRAHVPAGQPDPRSQAHIDQAAGILKAALDGMVERFSAALPARQLQAAIAGYNCGTARLASPDTVDAVTTGHDYSNDVWERARFYAVGW
jgi:soluble lytic murein transglycosylase-like protein